jgi:hypothetical protein
VSELAEVMVAGPPGITYEASWGRRPPRKSTTWWAGVVHERVDGGGMELWSCEHRHQAEAQALACAVAWATGKARQELAAYEPPPGLPELRGAVERMFGGMPVVFDDPWDEPESDRDR